MAKYVTYLTQLKARNIDYHGTVAEDVPMLRIMGQFRNYVKSAMGFSFRRHKRLPDGKVSRVVCTDKFRQQKKWRYMYYSPKPQTNFIRQPIQL